MGLDVCSCRRGQRPTLGRGVDCAKCCRAAAPDPDFRAGNQPAIFRSDGSEGVREDRMRERYTGRYRVSGAGGDPESGRSIPNLTGSRSARCIDERGLPNPHADRRCSYGTASGSGCRALRTHDHCPSSASEPGIPRASTGRLQEAAGRLVPCGAVLPEPVLASRPPVPPPPLMNNYSLSGSGGGL